MISGPGFRGRAPGRQARQAIPSRMVPSPNRNASSAKSAGQNQGIRALPYTPGKNRILRLATKGVTAAANAITLPGPVAGE